MKVVVRERKSWLESVKEVGELKQRVAQLEEELVTEKRNHALASAGVQMWQRIANENEADARNWKVRADAAVKAKRDAEDLGMKAANDLATRLVKTMDEADTARAEAEDLRLELMERGVRIEELERRIEWLQAHSNTEADFVS